MLRGAIDYAAGSRVGGWIYSPEAQVRGKTVLAFVNDTCVGAGAVDQFREDLAKAGLGDGFIGFNFGISLDDDEDLGRVIVKIEGSDFALLQGDSIISGTTQAVGSFPGADRTMTSIEWMRTQGWLDQAEYDFLKFLRQVGIYDKSLRRPRVADAAAGLVEPLAAAGDLLSLLSQTPVVPTEKTYSDAEDFAVGRGELLSGLVEPIVALWSKTPGELLFAEGSHIDAEDQSRPLAGGIAHSFGPDRLLFVDLRGEFVSSGKAGSDLRVFLLTPTE